MNKYKPKAVKVIDYAQRYYRQAETACERWASSVVSDNFIYQYRQIEDRQDPRTQRLRLRMDAAYDRTYRRALPYFQRLLK